MDSEAYLKELIEQELNKCCKTSLPRLKKHISTDVGRETAQANIFRICKASGVSVQTAMSQIDTEL